MYTKKLFCLLDQFFKSLFQLNFNLGQTSIDNLFLHFQSSKGTEIKKILKCCSMQHGVTCLFDPENIVRLCDKSLALHMLRVPKQQNNMWGESQLPRQRNSTLLQLLPGLSKESHQLCGVEVIPSMRRFLFCEHLCVCV